MDLLTACGPWLQGKQSVSDSDGGKDGKVEMTPKGQDEGDQDNEAQPLQGRPQHWQPGSAVRLGSEGIPPAFDAREYHRHPEAFPSVRHFEPHTHGKVVSPAGVPLLRMQWLGYRLLQRGGWAAGCSLWRRCCACCGWASGCHACAEHDCGGCMSVSRGTCDWALWGL